MDRDLAEKRALSGAMVCRASDRNFWMIGERQQGSSS
jgi:hypothetical protein